MIFQHVAERPNGGENGSIGVAKHEHIVNQKINRIDLGLQLGQFGDTGGEGIRERMHGDGVRAWLIRRKGLRTSISRRDGLQSVCLIYVLRLHRFYRKQQQRSVLNRGFHIESLSERER